jgi:hypothetical protein
MITMNTALVPRIPLEIEDTKPPFNEDPKGLPAMTLSPFLIQGRPIWNFSESPVKGCSSITSGQRPEQSHEDLSLCLEARAELQSLGMRLAVLSDEDCNVGPEPLPGGPVIDAIGVHSRVD